MWTVWLISFGLLSACTHVTLPDIEACAVAGIMAGGADCVKSISGGTRSLTLDELIAMLEPQLDPPRGAAIIISAEDFTRLKVAIEQACAKLKGCSKEVEAVSGRLVALQTKVSAKKPRQLSGPPGR